MKTTKVKVIKKKAKKARNVLAAESSCCRGHI
jgi:hypothetical protein